MNRSTVIMLLLLFISTVVAFDPNFMESVLDPGGTHRCIVGGHSPRVLVSRPGRCDHWTRQDLNDGLVWQDTLQYDAQMSDDYYDLVGKRMGCRVQDRVIVVAAEENHVCDDKQQNATCLVRTRVRRPSVGVCMSVDRRTGDEDSTSNDLVNVCRHTFVGNAGCGPATEIVFADVVETSAGGAGYPNLNANCSWDTKAFALGAICRNGRCVKRIESFGCDDPV